MTFQGNPKPYTPPTHPATIIRYIMAVPYLSTAAPWLNLNCPGSSLSKKPNGNTATSTSSSFPPSPWHSPPTGQECPEGATLSHKQRRRGIPRRLAASHIIRRPIHTSLFPSRYICSTSALVSRAMTSSSLVGMTKPRTVESGVVISRSTPCTKFFPRPPALPGTRDYAAVRCADAPGFLRYRP